MASDATVVLTGLLTLAGALGGATLSTVSTARIARRNEFRQDIKDLRRERIRIYGSFLLAIASLQTSADYLASVLQREAHAEMDAAWSAASSARDGAMHALSELELFAGNDVRTHAVSLLALAQEHYRLSGEGKSEVSLGAAQTATTTAMQDEIGISSML